MQLVLGECLASAMKPARFVFREVMGKVLFHVDQVLPVKFWHYTKFRSVMALELAWSPTAGSRSMRLSRPPGGWKASWVLKDSLGGELFNFVPSSSFWPTSRIITNVGTGAVATTREGNPFIFGPQEAEIVDLGGQPLARAQWSDYSWRLGCHSNVRIELQDESWELGALAYAIIRWANLQGR